MIIGKTFKFDAAHFLPNHKGKCKNLHGHTWKVIVELKGSVNTETGMVVDFGDVKEIVNGRIIDYLDHQNLNNIFPKTISPTCEHIAKFIFHLLEKGLPIYQIIVQEGDGGYARYKKE